MKKPDAVWAAAAFAAVAGIPLDALPQASATPDTPRISHAFVDVNVLPMDDERVVAGQTVLVADGRIVQVGAAADVMVPDDVTVIDGSGRYLMPGVAEMHGHYPNPDAQEFTEAVMHLYVANGVTLVRGMQGGASHLPLRDAIEAREIVGPRLLVCAPAISGNNVTQPEDARRLVREAAAAGFDHIKVFEGLTPEVFSAIAETAAEVGLTFSGHVSNLVGLYSALEQGQSTIDHLDNYIEAMIDDPEIVGELGLLELPSVMSQVDEAKLGDVIAATVEAGAGVVPTEVLWETFLGGRSGADFLAEMPETRYWVRESIPGVASGVNRWAQQTDGRSAALPSPDAGRPVIELRRRLIKELYDAGVPVLLGTDSPQIFSVPGFSIHREMQVMVESGLTPYQVLHAGTAAVADFLGAEDFGRIAEGQRADLVLLNANPLDDIGHFADSAGVMVNGVWLSRSDIDERLDAIEALMEELGG
ncbi:MAG: amidohydrolase family protein [Rhodospirillaceae bacterium]|nr:amidohydrolase family protein [Rhodospirillaceae bacterium]